MADLSFSERMADAYKKVSSFAKIGFGALPGGPFQLGTRTVRGVPMRVFTSLPDSVAEYFFPWFEMYADREWLVYENQRFTYGESLRQIRALGAELVHSFGVQVGDRVGIAMRNYPEFLISFMAIVGVGAVAVPLNALWKSEELEYAVTDAACKVMIVDSKRLGHCMPFRHKLALKFVLVRGDVRSENAIASQAVAWSEVVHAGSIGASLPYPQVTPEDEAMIMYTSGSTGFPKGVVHTQRSVATAMKVGELASVVSPDSRGVRLMAVPLFHITALCPIGLFSIPCGYKIIIMYKWDAGRALEYIQSEGVSQFTGVPTMMRDLMEHPAFTPEKIATLKSATAGGAPIPPSQVKKMRQKAKTVDSQQGYGLTETMALATHNKGVDYLLHPTSCGKPIPFLVSLVIKDPSTGKVVPDGKRGEICIKGPMVMKCYNNLPEKTASAIDAEGYFHSGDIGKIEGGFVYVLDRIKDLIIRGGENIDCSEVEAALSAHPAAREVSVFGLPDERLGEVVGAAIWCTEDVKVEEICARAAQTLAKFKVPLPENVFIHKAELPKGATGKLDKKGMRDHYSAVVKARSVQLKAKL